jgi:DNA-binding transcriptional LysR family regulator
MELRDLRLFVAVAEAAGFRRAARHLGTRQSIVSKRVRTLEDTLGVSLFERHSGGVRLTHAGEHFLSDVRVVLGRLSGAVASVRAAGCAGEGRFKIGIADSVSAGFLRQLLESWIRDHPTIRLDLFEAGPKELLGGVLNREIDVTFLTGATWPPGCDTQLLWHDHVFVAVPATSLYAKAAAVRLVELADERFIVSQGGFGPEIRDFIVKRISDLGVSPAIDVMDVSREVLITMVGLGFGLTLTASLEVGVIYPNVKFVQVADEKLPFSAVWSPENDNPALRRFLSHARVAARNWAKVSEPIQNPDPASGISSP